MGSAFHQLCPRYSGTLPPLPLRLSGYGKPLPVFVAPALAGRYRRASFRPFVRSYVRPFVRPSVRPSTFNMGSCERNSSYSFAPIVLKLCMWDMWDQGIGHNCWINFCHFFDIVNLVIFHPDYIDRGYLL